MKKVLVTGGASGIGKMICETLLNKGYYVFACDVNKEGLAEYNNENVMPVYMDITSESTICDAYVTVSNKTDSLYAIINCAGIAAMGSLIEDDVSKTEKTININLLGMMRVNKQFFPLIKDNRGRIINISSECGWMEPAPFNGPYTISKYAVEAYTDSLRRELNFLGIKVIKIQPGSFKTKMHDATLKNLEKLRNDTIYFKDIVSKLGKTTEKELKNANDPKYLMETVLDAIENEEPKICYRVKNSKSMKLISKFSSKTVDKIYLKALK